MLCWSVKRVVCSWGKCWVCPASRGRGIFVLWTPHLRIRFTTNHDLDSDVNKSRVLTQEFIDNYHTISHTSVTGSNNEVMTYFTCGHAETFQLCWLDVSSTCGSIFEALQCDWVCWVWASGDFHRIMWPSWLHIYKFFKAVRISHWDDPDPDGWTDPVDHLVAGVLQPISSSVSCFVLHLHSYVTSVQ